MRLPLALLVLAAIALGGCADAVDPTLGTDQAFSLYGYLDPTADRQAVRVVPITATLEADTARALDVEVTSVEPAAGRSTTWRDTTVTYGDGSPGYVFVADGGPTAGARVEIRVEAADGGRASVTVDVPPVVPAEVGPPDTEGLGVYPVTVRGVPRVISGVLRLYVAGLPGATGEAVLTVPTDEIDLVEAGDDHTVRVPFFEATKRYLQAEGLFDVGLRLIEAEYAAFVANEAWAVPPGGLDLDAVVEPGTFSNVAGGFGFVGAGYWSAVRWSPAPDVQRLAGFSVTDDPAAALALNEIGDGFVELYNPTTLPIRVGGYAVTMAGPGGAVEIDGGVEIAPGGFHVVDGPFAAGAGQSALLLDPAGVALVRRYVVAEAGAWGAYPDGFSYPVGRTGEDLFYGPVEPSPGEPNRLEVVEAVVNEIATQPPGFVEAFSTAAFDSGELRAASTPEALAGGGVLLQGGPPFFSARPENGLVLRGGGGIVFLSLRGRVVDVRRYAAQPADRTAGYLPDGPTGEWTPTLRSTRGSPNLRAR